MNALLQEETPYHVEQHAFDGILAYLRMLVTKYPGTIEFQTGAGHLFFDLIRHIPPIATFEEERRELCHMIEEHIYPLAASLFAQAVDVVITVSPDPLAPPAHVDALESFTAFDSGQGVLRHGFLSPHHVPPDFTNLSIAAGMTVECRPLNYHYHQLFDDRAMYPQNAASNLPSRDYAGRNKDPKGGYSEDNRTVGAAPLLETKAVPRWLLEGPNRENALSYEVMPRVSGGNGTTHIPGYIRLLNVSPHHIHTYDESLPAWKWRPEPRSPAQMAAAYPVETVNLVHAVVKPMVEETPLPHRSVYVGLPAPGLVPGWYRETL